MLASEQTANDEDIALVAEEAALCWAAEKAALAAEEAAALAAEEAALAAEEAALAAEEQAALAAEKEAAMAAGSAKAARKPFANLNWPMPPVYLIERNYTSHDVGVQTLQRQKTPPWHFRPIRRTHAGLDRLSVGLPRRNPWTTKSPTPHNHNSCLSMRCAPGTLDSATVPLRMKRQGQAA